MTESRTKPPAAELRRFRVKFAGTCVLCGTPLAEGSEALYHATTKTVRCLTCPTGPTRFAAGQFDVGTPGASAWGEYIRRMAKRENETKIKYGERLGGLVLRLTSAPQSTRAWADGARGEAEVAAWLRVPGVIVLSDRRVPGTRGNIDHLVLSPAGVFLVDAKNYHGRLLVHDSGWPSGNQTRLYVGRRECSHLADNMAWQVRAVQALLTSVGAPFSVTPVLCFLNVVWPLVSPPGCYRGVRLEGPRSLRRLISGWPVIDPTVIPRLAGTMATAFPSKHPATVGPTRGR